jgi:hypothetical protein
MAFPRKLSSEGLLAMVSKRVWLFIENQYSGARADGAQKACCGQT